MQTNRFSALMFRCLPLAVGGWLALAVHPASAAQLIADGMFVTTPNTLSTSPTPGYSQDVGRLDAATTPTYTFSGTTGSAGWQTTEADARFEVWTPGFMGSPASAGNTLELANTAKGATIYQDVVAAAGGGQFGTFSFGYSTRDGAGVDKFTVTVTDRTSNAVLFSQQFNPSDPFSTNDTFSTGLTLTAGDTYRVAFLDQNTFSSGTQSAHIDSVSLTQVPEPATWLGACLLLGGAGLLARRRFRLAAV